VGAFCAWFFRDPERPIPAGAVAVSPADGRVVSVVSEGDRQTRISIFLNIFDVHVNRSPISGVITDITYKRGQFLVASREVASAENEQNILTVQASDGTKVIFKQIAGLIARRIVCTKQVGDVVQAGERVGLIKFGSRVDVVLGPEWRVEVSPGSHVSAGSSILARRAGDVELALPLAASIEEAALCRT
jgi:phosphatidylserine decarboxylase